MSETERNECMVDLETLGNGNNAVILSIGACKFQPSGQGVPIDTGHRFERFVDPQTCVDAGLQMDASTIMWWMEPERGEARDLMAKRQETDAISLGDALWEFSKWLGSDMPVWGNGATFDNVILRNAFKAVGIECPWKFWNDRCYRTVKNMAPSVKMQRKGVYHSALWDAVSQAEHLQSINRFLTSGE